ncbi:uncharacterized protein [Prorops nasuta]|uniref:uncharacterized protein n=1 Tax=Prorops nasuta TaxID=863751 RepID=UPI0034D00FCD
MAIFCCQMRRLASEITTTANKLVELEEIVKTCKLSEKLQRYPTGDIAGRKRESTENSMEEIKILEASFPPLSTEPPRKYGIFVSRPPGQRTAPLASTTLAAKLKLK